VGLGELRVEVADVVEEIVRQLEADLLASRSGVMSASSADALDTLIFTGDPARCESEYLADPEKTAEAVARAAIAGRGGAEAPSRCRRRGGDRGARRRVGQSVMAFVVPAGCVERSDALELELRAHCEREMAGCKQARAFEFRDGLPYSPAGKLLRRELREPFWA
jgi:acyl-CoA synthetase (AMP-forming)/AMP-acid ligase II